MALLLVSCRSQPSSIDRDRCEADGQFTFIRAGEFVSGSDEEERNYAYRISAVAMANETRSISEAEVQLRQRRWFDGEDPKEVRSLPSFCIQTYPITNSEYQEFVRETNHRQPGMTEAEYRQQGFLVHPYEEVEPYLWENGNYPDSQGQHPAILVSYEDAEAFAKWKGEGDGFTYRLPTANEWEKAARGREGNYFPWGNQWQDEATNWGGNDPYHTTPVGAFPGSTSPYRVEEMAGNTFEYTSTLYDIETGKVSVMKGCSWDDLPGFCRGAYRHTRPVRSRHILFGFRLVKE